MDDDEGQAGVLVLCLGVMLAGFGWAPEPPWDTVTQVTAGVLTASGAWLMVRSATGASQRD